MNAASSEVSLFDRIGGAGGVATLVRDFYSRVLADPALRPYFNGVAMDKLKRMQFEFFSAALGGPVYYSGLPVVHAHQGRGITRHHFQAFVEHLFETLKDYSLTEQDRYTIIARINTYADDVISRGVGMDT